MSQFYPEGKNVTIAGEELTIMPFVLRDRTKVVKIVVNIMVELAKANPNLRPEDIDPAKLAVIAPAMIEAAGERIIEIYEIVLKKDREWLNNNLTIKNEIEILQAISEVNDVNFLISQVKGLIKEKK